MHRDRLLRSTPFRLALTFGLLFIIAFLVSGFVTYQLMKRELELALDDSVREIYSVVSLSYAPGDDEDLVTTINAYASLDDRSERVFSLVNSSGGRIAGNVAAPHLPDGLSFINGAALGLPEDEQFRVFSGDVGPNRLMVGQSVNETDDLQKIVVMSLGWASALMVLIAVAGGALLAYRAQRRLDGIAKTMVEVSHGKLDGRIPLRGNGDDIDVVSSQINHALDRLSGLVEGMRQVSADIAHELKTPLNRLKMTIEDALNRDDKGEAIGTHLIEALAESDQINATFEALLRISQIEAGARKTRFTKVDLCGLMTAVAEIYGNVAEDNNQTLTFKSQTSMPCLMMGDRELLTQLFVNLVENAINHCPPGTHITMSLAVDGTKLRAIVADNGNGIPPHEQERVFRRLYRLDKSRTTPGSGLGLSLVRAIVDLHTGVITLSDNDPGLKALMIFPMADGI